MPKYRYAGKAPMRIGSTEVRDGAVIEWEYNPEPKQFTEVVEPTKPVVAEAPSSKGRKSLAITTEEET